MKSVCSQAQEAKADDHAVNSQAMGLVVHFLPVSELPSVYLGKLS